MRLAVITDIHHGSGKKRLHDHTRACYELAKLWVPTCLESIAHFKPDLLINLGDLIQHQEPLADRERYLQGLQWFTHKDFPVIHILGNHEVWGMSEAEIQSLWEQVGINQTLFGTRVVAGWRIIWLSMEQLIREGKKIHRVPESQLNWLTMTLQGHPEPALLFAHCAVNNQNTQGNFYFDTSAEEAHYINQTEIRKIISQFPQVKAVIGGHLHWLHYQKQQGITFLTLPAMVENIAAPLASDVLPGVFSILDISPITLNLKVFAAEYAFASLELEF